MSFESVESLAAVFGGAAPFVVWVTRKILAKIDKVLHKFDEIASQVTGIKTDMTAMDAKIDGVRDRVEKIEPVIAELKPNGGSSIKDEISQLMEKVTILDGRHHARFDGDGTATYECGPDGMCTYASAALGALYGMSPDQFLGNGWLTAVGSAGERQRVWDCWRTAVHAGIPYEDTYVVQTPTGLHQIRTYTRAVKDRTGKILRYFGIVIDLGPAADHYHPLPTPKPPGNTPP